ncbi:MAG: DUF2288 domain-containing protein [Gammaproteobacteria bacterium]|nr:DUF2288 domain-containing protein [Gammaproteobacteria bacterium]
MNDEFPDITPELSRDELQQTLNMETARISWSELEKHFARGVLITVAPRLDLIETALHFIQNDKKAIEPLLASEDINRTTDKQAQQWSSSEPELWAVVVAPWVLVQQRGTN